MATEIIVTDEFKAWYEGQSEDVQAKLIYIVGLLEEKGVTLESPYSSQIKGAKSLRELRTTQGGSFYRILYAFDPERQAILLVGGDKKSSGNRWYATAIALAERLFDEYLRGL